MGPHCPHPHLAMICHGTCASQFSLCRCIPTPVFFRPALNLDLSCEVISHGWLTPQLQPCNFQQSQASRACHEHPAALRALKIDDPKWARGPRSRSQRSRCLRAWRIFEGKGGEKYINSISMHPLSKEYCEFTSKNGQHWAKHVENGHN